jgi:hypothetical protein
MGQLGSFTRRTMLGRAAAAGAASLLPAGLADARTHASVVRSGWLGGLNGTSPIVAAPQRFVLVGVQWRAPANARIDLRAMSPGGHWSPWVAAASLGHDPDGRARVAGLFGEPLWTGEADAVQLRSDRSVGGLRLHFISPRAPVGRWAARTGATASDQFPLATPVLDAGPGQPPIIARQGWAQGQAPPGPFAGYGTVELAFVHHTVNPNGYSAAEVPAMLRAIFDYHRYVRGYLDIAYNFLIDAYGRIWEGRAGGIDMAVIGAHAGGYNLESTGVAMLGDFMDVVPPPVAMDALRHLLAWKLSLHGVPTLGRVTVVVDPASAFYTPFAPGANVSLPRIAGHRDGDLTDCPGNALYYRLPLLRQKVRALAGTPARVTANATLAPVLAGTPVVVSGGLGLLDGTPLPASPVEVQELLPAGETTVANATTAADGSWTESLALEHNTIVRALHRPAPASVSDWLEILVAPAITLTIQSTSPVQVSGTVTPPKPHVLIELYNPGHPHKPVARKRVRTTQGSFSATLAAPAPGDYLVLARTVADATNAAGASPKQSVAIS